MHYRRLPIEIESPEERGYGTIRNNLTESSVRDMRLGDLGLDLGDLVLAYGDHRGDPALRHAVAAQAGDRVGPEHVLATPGAAGALFIVATTLLEPGDHLVVARTNYSTNIETPRLIGADCSYLDLRFEDDFALDPDQLSSLVRPGVTRLVSLTYPHNPTGAMIPVETLRSVIELVEAAGAWLLVDETYRELTHGEALPTAASLSERAISVCSLSKSYGLPGIRQGWILTRSGELAERFLAAKEQIVICGSALDEAVAAAVLTRRDELLPPIRSLAAEHLRIVVDGMAAQEQAA
jgi:aspartate/methionine/tyrosine aminotransferase